MLIWCKKKSEKLKKNTHKKKKEHIKPNGFFCVKLFNIDNNDVLLMANVIVDDEDDDDKRGRYRDKR